MKRSIAIEIIRNNEIEILELKNTVNEKKNAIKNIDSRMKKQKKEFVKQKMEPLKLYSQR